MYYDPSDERSYIYYVKLPLVNKEFAVGCKNLRSATIGDLIDLGKIQFNICQCIPISYL